MTTRPSSSLPGADAAIQWLLLLRDPSCTAEDKQAFERWRAMDDSHRREYEVLLTVWDRMDVLADQPTSASRTSPTPASSKMTGRHRGSKTLRIRETLISLVGIAAMLVMTVSLFWFWNLEHQTIESYRTAKGEQRQITLPDKTVMELNSDSEVTTRFSARTRQVIIEHGEAYFTVAHENDRRFEVTAANGKIQDIGTQFSVYRQSDRVVVTVEEGEVRIDVTEPSSHPSTTHSLTQGQRALYTLDGRWASADPIDPRQIAAWRRGALILNDVPLVEALREVNRHWPGTIVLADTSLETVRIKGRFNLRNLDEFFLALPTILPVEVVHRAGDVIISKK